jgi:hypothetical protein
MPARSYEVRFRSRRAGGLLMDVITNDLGIIALVDMWRGKGYPLPLTAQPCGYGELL